MKQLSLMANKTWIDVEHILNDLHANLICCLSQFSPTIIQHYVFVEYVVYIAIIALIVINATDAIVIKNILIAFVAFIAMIAMIAINAIHIQK